MPTDASFRFSTYLSFALVFVTLGYAESSLLPEVLAFAVLAVLGLAALYFLESRVTLLSIPAANRLGIVVVIGYMLWAVYRIAREWRTQEFINMGWHMLIVAMCGPLVMVLIVAKVARRDKHAGDYWALHGIALAGVGLAAAFAEEVTCFVLLGFYLIAAVWSLTLLHLGRARGAIPPIPGGKQPATKAVAVAADPTGHRTDLRPAIVWAVVGATVALPLYLLTPRSKADKADFGKPRIEIGYAADQMVDLNTTGQLKTNTEPAFEVTATNVDGSPKDNLNRDQRWRGRTMRVYLNGEWKPSEDPLPQITSFATHPAVWSPPNLGPDQYTLSFSVPARLRGLFVADPVQWAPEQPSPLAGITDGTKRGWLPVADGTFFWEPAARGPRGTPRSYVQVYRSGADPDVGPAFRFIDRRFDQHFASLRINPVPRVAEYAESLLRDLIRAGEFPEKCRDPVSLHVLPEYQDKLARRFAAHLASTSTLEYTTDLKRSNPRVDPIEDFLFHSKTGHCERFATALVLMLRSQGIPAVFVLGFKGCEYDENGKYIVRQEHAHAWVSALVAKPDEPFDPKKDVSRVYQWRSLDPTPGSAQGSEENANRPWWKQANNWVGNQFQEYVANYTPEQRQRALADFVSRLARPTTLIAIAVIIFGGLGIRYARRRIAQRRAHPPAVVSEPARWFSELVVLLTAHGIVPAPGDTPFEFATGAATALRARPNCAPVCGVPLEWAEAYYLDRFGGVPPSDARRAELGAALQGLRRALTSQPTEDRG